MSNGVWLKDLLRWHASPPLPPPKQVANPGQALKTLGSAFLNIMWPYELANGKWLLYPVSMNFDGHLASHCTPAEAMNPLSLHGPSPAQLVNQTVSVIREKVLKFMFHVEWSTPKVGVLEDGSDLSLGFFFFPFTFPWLASLRLKIVTRCECCCPFRVYPTSQLGEAAAHPRF